MSVGRVWRRIRTEAAPALEGLDVPSAVLVCTAGAVLLASRYHGSLGAYHRYFGRSLKGAPFESLYDHLVWFILSTVFYGIIPFLTLLALRGEKLSDYGLGLGDKRLGWKITGFFFAVMAPVVIAVSFTGTFAKTYPLDRSALTSLSYFLVYELAYISYFVAWEFLFRSYLLFGLAKRMGNHAIWVQLLPFALMHYGKPEAEAYGSIIAGIALAVLALRTRSFWYGAFLHAGIAVLMDTASALQYLLAKTG